MFITLQTLKLVAHQVAKKAFIRESLDRDVTSSQTDAFHGDVQR